MANKAKTPFYTLTQVTAQFGEATAVEISNAVWFAARGANDHASEALTKAARLVSDVAFAARLSAEARRIHRGHPFSVNRIVD